MEKVEAQFTCWAGVALRSVVRWAQAKGERRPEKRDEGEEKWAFGLIIAQDRVFSFYLNLIFKLFSKSFSTQTIHQAIE